MRIKTQFIITMLLFGAVLAAMAATAVITGQQALRASEQEDIASRIAQGASELSYLANDYVIYRESQQLDRWHARFASFSEDVARLRAGGPEQQAIVSNIQANSQRLQGVFDSVASAVGSSPDQGGTADLEMLQVSWSRLAVQTQGLVSDASRLSVLLDDQEGRSRRDNTIIVIALAGVFGAYFLANYLVTQRRALRGIARLQAGTAIIGAGDLDFRIGEQGNDEIGDLSRDVNRMTADLKDVTASKADLEREVAARIRVEEELRTANEQLEETAVELEAEIDERKRAEEETSRQAAIVAAINRVSHEYLTSGTEEDLGVSCLKVAEELTQSEFGFIGEVGADGLLHNIAMSRLGWEACSMYDRTGRHRPPGNFQIHGLYGQVLADDKSLLCNDPQAHPDSIGTPVGHPPIKAFLGVPLYHAGKTVGILAMANRAGGYRREDLEAAEALASAIVEVLMHKRAEEALRESEQRFATTLASIGDAVITTDLEGRVAFMNAESERLTGWTFSDAAGRPIADVFNIVNEETRQAVESPVAKVIREGMVVGLANHTVLVKKDGTEVPIDDSGAPIRDATGKTTGVVLVFRDITERRRAVQALRESQVELAAIFDSSPILMLLVDKETRVRTVNRAAESFVGRPEREMTGLRGGEAIRCLHSLDDPRGCGYGPHCQTCRIRAAVTRTLETGQSEYQVDATLQVGRRDQSRDVHVLLSTAPIQTNGEEMVLVCIEDVTERREAQEALRRSEELYRSLVDSTGSVVVRVDRHGKRTFVSPQAAEATHRSVEDLLAGDFGDMMAPDDREMAVEALDKVFTTGGPVTGLATRQTWAGNEVHVVVNYVPVKDSKGNVEEVQVTTTDITALRRAEEALRRSEELYRSLADVEGNAVIRVNREGKRTFVSRYTAQLRGMTVEQMLEERFGEALAPEDKERSWAMLHEVFDTGKVVSGLVTRQLWKGGAERWISSTYSPVRDEHGNVVEVQIASYDVSDQVRADRMMRFNEELYRSLVNATGASVVRVDRDGRRTFVKEAIMPRPEGDMRAGMFGDTLAPEDRQRSWDVLQGVFETGEPVRGFTAKGIWNDVETYVMSNYEPVFDDRGNVVEVQVTTNDITDLKRLQQELEEADRMKDQFLSDIAHELQTPVTTAKMSLGFISTLEANSVNERVRRFMGNASASMDQLEKLVKDLLDLTRLQNHRLELKREAVEVGTLVNQAIERHGPVFAQKGVSFTLGPCPPSLAYADSRRIQQVLDNLLSNACKYTQEGGSVTLSCQQEADRLIVSVADTGAGIAMEDRARLFQRFERLPTDRQAAGIGLGLAISRGIVELHGGRIWVESEVGKGSIFRFSLPRGDTAV